MTQTYYLWQINAGCQIFIGLSALGRAALRTSFRRWIVRLRLHIVFFSNSYCFQNFTFIVPYFIFFSFPFYLLFPFHSFYFIFSYFLFSIYMFRNVCTCIFPLAFDILNYFLFLIFYFIWFLIISYQIYFSFIL